MAKTLVEQKKKQRQLLLVVGAIIFLTAGIFIFGGGGEEEEIIEDDITTEAISASAQAIVSDISIPTKFFEDSVLEDFLPYEPTKAPDTRGRINPFAPIGENPDAGEGDEEEPTEEES